MAYIFFRYVLLHICHTQDNATAVVRAQDKEFNLCDPLAMETTWAEFDKEVLQNTLGHWEIEAFNRTYHADAKVGTTAVPYLYRGPADWIYWVTNLSTGNKYPTDNGIHSWTSIEGYIIGA